MRTTFSDEFIQTLPQEALQQIQVRKFQLLISELLQSNRFYGEKLRNAGVNAFEDIADLSTYGRLPFTTKTELVADQVNNSPYGTNLTFPREEYARIHQTSGTTGVPLVLLDTEESWDWWARCWTTIYRAAGIADKDRIFFAFSFGPFIGFWSAHSGAQMIGALSIPGGGMSSLQRLNAVTMHEVTVLICTPTYALHLAEVAKEEGIDIGNSSVRTVICAGEPGAGLPATRQRIEQAWGAKCYDHAGATEVGAWGFEHKGSSGLYVNEGEFIFEVIDPSTGELANEGELVITNLGRVGMPIIRYRTGDHVKLSREPSTVGGITYRKLDGGVIGRVDDVMVVRGINVYPSAIENILRRFPEVGEFAVDIYRKQELDVLDIRVEIDDSLPESLAQTVSTEIHNSLGLRAQITVAPFGTLPRFDLKARRFTDHRSTDGD